MDVLERLKTIELFADLSDEDLGRISHDVVEVRLEPGELLFQEDDPGHHAYLVTSGSVEVVKSTGGRDALLAIRETGSVIGEMALLEGAPRMASVRARGPTQLLSIPKATLDQLLESSPQAARAMFRTLMQRMRETSQRLRESERMAQLGTLTAGVAHELNNPAAAVQRAAQRLDAELEPYMDLFARSPSPEGVLARERAIALAAQRTARDEPVDTDALTRMDRESAVEDWLATRGVAEPWQLASELVEAGLDVEQIEQLGDGIQAAALEDAARLLVTSSTIRRLVTEIAEGSRRLSDIVRALKGYAFLDQAPVQDVDVVQGLEDTLVLLGHKVRHVRVDRDFEPGLPTITALGSELNQVWTNLIDNACDALAEVDDRTPTLTLRAYTAADDVVVEIEDNGPGIPDEVRDRIFDAFFTTKPPGHGTGLGLQVSYRIVVFEHHGELSVESEPGRTIFRVTLPVHSTEVQRRPAADGDGQSVRSS